MTSRSYDNPEDTQARMHDDEVGISTDLVRRLLADQFPQHARERLSIIRSTGTVNCICRIGTALYARLPRVAAWAEGLVRELQFLPRVAPGAPLAVPRPVARGLPSSDYPFEWGIYQWIEGAPYSTDNVIDQRRAARDLAAFIRHLGTVDADGAPRAGRPPLEALDQMTRAAIESIEDRSLTRKTFAAWDLAREAPSWDGTPRWIHADLIPPNLLSRNGALCAVLDFGSAGVGDPAADIIPAWAVLDAVGRFDFREQLAVDAGTWRRARGYALHQALMILPYYRESNPRFVEMAWHTVSEVLEDRT